MTTGPQPTTPRARFRRATVVVALTLLGAAIPAVAALGVAPVGDPVAVAETEPVLSAGDAADDIAVWVDPADGARSVIVGTDKLGALEVYDLTGARLQRITADGAPNNVDLRRGFPLAGGRVDVVATAGGGFLRFYTLDPATRLLTNRSARVIQPGVNAEGVCMYRSPTTGSVYAFVDAPDGRVEQWELFDRAGAIDARLVRGPFDIGGTMEGCVADDDLGAVYFTEQHTAIWRYGAEPGDPTTTRTAVDLAAPAGHFTADVEGLAIVRLDPEGHGYLLASSQGSDSYMAYRRDGDHAFVRSFQILAGTAADGCTRTDGIEAVAADLGPSFPDGIFVCQDFHNTAPGTAGNQNFKIVPLGQVVDLRPPDGPTTTTAPEAPPTGTGSLPAAPAPDPPLSGRAATAGGGYWLLDAAGTVYAFGDARDLGGAGMPAATTAVDLEPSPGGGYWVLDSAGGVHPVGDAPALPPAGGPALALQPGERAASLSATPSGRGYWVSTDRGRVLPAGDAPALGDMAGVTLNGPVLDSVGTPTGRGYFMVATDGGIFAFGDARFAGSMGGSALNAPVRSLVPDGDGYWLVASDGGVFAFDAPFRGSMGGRPLNRPVTGMVRYGDGYLMVAEDGGIFDFSDRPFAGSLGDRPPSRPVVSVAAAP